MSELSILIPARNEPFLQKTVEDILEHMEGDTEVLVGLDGYLPEWVRPIDLNPVYESAIKYFHLKDSIGQRAMTNHLARLSTAKYLMKTDAHCSFSQGFDVEMMKDMQENRTLIPVLLNLHVYDWVCPAGHRTYQGKVDKCSQCDNRDLRQEMVWEPKHRPILSNFAFDSNMVFQHIAEQSPEALNETMCIQGCGWMVTREKYWELDLSGEEFGSWGSQGVEVSCKTWLSGGECVCTKNAYMGHLFRSEEEFPYQRDMKQVDHANAHARDLFLNSKWPKAQRKLSWLIEKFNYPCDWTPEKVKELIK